MGLAAPARPESDSRAIRSYRRRGSRLTECQQEAWDSFAHRWVIPVDAQTSDGFRLTQVFTRQAPVVAEIGFGVGEALVAAARSRPESNILGFEVWQPGVAECLAALDAAGCENARLSTLDATWCLEHIIDPGTVAELWTFFPDPWPRRRHHKRRLVNPGFAHLAATRLVPGATWRLATDWPQYADHMREVLDATPTLQGGITQRHAGRPMTRFERRGLAAGRPVADLTYTRWPNR